MKPLRRTPRVGKPGAQPLLLYCILLIVLLENSWAFSAREHVGEWTSKRQPRVATNSDSGN